MKNRKLFGMNVGTSSALIIIVILCLVCFSGLSIASASADYRLSQKLAERTTSYYSACNKAQETLLTLSDELASLYKISVDQEDYEAKIKESLQDSLTFSYPINENQVLKITVTPLYPQTEEGDFFEVTGWQVMNLSSPDPDTSLSVFGSK